LNLFEEYDYDHLDDVDEQIEEEYHLVRVK